MFVYVLAAQISASQAGPKFKTVRQKVWKNISRDFKKIWLFKMQSKGLKIEMEAWHNQEVCKTWKKSLPPSFLPMWDCIRFVYPFTQCMVLSFCSHSPTCTVEVKLSHSNILLELVLIFKKYIKLVLHIDLQNCHDCHSTYLDFENTSTSLTYFLKISILTNLS